MYLEAEMSGSIPSVDRLSPPSSLSVSRLSDSDISELDFEEGLTRRGMFDHKFSCITCVPGKLDRNAFQNIFFLQL